MPNIPANSENRNIFIIEQTLIWNALHTAYFSMVADVQLKAPNKSNDIVNIYKLERE